MSVPAQLCLGLMMLCLSAVFAIGLGSVLQYRAIARTASAHVSYAEVHSASLLPPVYPRKASF
jgi:drug/metabolite transporter (DMT)-like permease